MIPAGYLAKRVSVCPDWIKSDRIVADIYSVSGCVSKDFADYIGYWKHNGYWLFDSPDIILQLARQHAIDLTGTKLFFYQVHELECDDEGRWTAFSPEPSFPTEVVIPAEKALEGYDIVTFFAKASAECSPLSCNGLAAELEVNQHCLLASFERAKQLLEEGRFRNSEPGPYRIFEVYSTEWPRPARGV